MNALRRVRRFARLLAAWLLLSFIAMAAAPIGQLRAADAPVVAISKPADEHCADAEDHGQHDHVSPGEHEAEPDSGHRHAGHAAGSVSDCPLCMHAAAPPPPQLAPRLAGGAPSGCPTTGQRTPVRVRTAAPPPGRGPPVLS